MAMHKLNLIGAVCLMSFGTLTVAQPLPASPGTTNMQAMMDAIAKGDFSAFPEAQQRAIRSGFDSAVVSAQRAQDALGTVAQFEGISGDTMERAAREAFIASLPPRDRSLGMSVLNGANTDPNWPGRFYIFVSKTMPMSMLRAYALDAMYLGGTLVMKGIRKGDTIAEYLNQAFIDFNTMEGMHLASIELNPNLYDMFDIKVVPTVVWTNVTGLDDVGSGCPQVPDYEKPAPIKLKDYKNDIIEVEKPACGKLPQHSYYKLAGALSMEYVVDRFSEAGMPPVAVSAARRGLAARTGAYISTTQPELGNAQRQVSTDFDLSLLPRSLYEQWATSLKSNNVQRTPYGPAFSTDGEDDAEYRQELIERIERGLSLTAQ